MKAIVCTQYGSPNVLKLEEVEKPAPTDDEVLIKVYAAGANAADWHLLEGKPLLVRLAGYGLFKPKHKIPGAAVARRVEAVGRKSSSFNQVMKFSETYPGAALVLLPSMYVFLKMH